MSFKKNVIKYANSQILKKKKSFKGSTAIEIEPRAFSTGSSDKKTQKVRDEIFKALDENSQQFDKRALEEAESSRGYDNIIEPPYDKALLIRTIDRSDVLSSSIEAFVDSVEGFGYRLEPIINIDSEDGIEEFRMHLEEKKGEDVSDTELKKEIKKFKMQMRQQKKKVEFFLKNAPRSDDGFPISFQQLQIKKRSDKEKTGEYYVEVVRDKDKIVTMNHVPSAYIKKTIVDTERTSVQVYVQDTDFTLKKRKEYRFFRRYIQTDRFCQSVVWFKEFGDPRVFSSKTGLLFKSEEDLSKAEPGVPAATELLHGKIFHALTPYGQPRWVTNVPGAIGKRKAEIVNADFFDNKAIPPQIIMVSGGSLASDAEQKIKDHLEGLKGTENFHKVLVLEAIPFNAGLPGQTPHRVQLEVKSLMDKMQSDALFLNYKNYNDKMIPERWRMPGLLLGRSGDYTRATAKEAYKNFEETVATPEREVEDQVINQVIFPEIGVSLWKYVTNGREITDPEDMSKLIETSMKNGALTPAEARPIMEKAFNIELPPLTGEWAQYPVDVYVAITQAGAKIESSLNQQDRNIDPSVEPSEAGQESTSVLSNRTEPTSSISDTRQAQMETPDLESE